MSIVLWQLLFQLSTYSTSGYLFQILFYVERLCEHYKFTNAAEVGMHAQAVNTKFFIEQTSQQVAIADSTSFAVQHIAITIITTF